MSEFRDVLNHVFSSDYLLGFAMFGFFSFLLVSKLAYEAYWDYFSEHEGGSLQKPGILDKFSPYHIVSADIFNAKAQPDMSAYLSSMLIIYRIVVVFFYAVIVLNIAYWVFVRNIFGLQFN